MQSLSNGSGCSQKEMNHKQVQVLHYRKDLSHQLTLRKVRKVDSVVY